MALSQKKLASLVSRIQRHYPAGGRRYSTIIEDPYQAGYMPLHKPTKRDLRDVDRALRKRGLASAR